MATEARSAEGGSPRWTIDDARRHSATASNDGAEFASELGSPEAFLSCGSAHSQTLADEGPGVPSRAGLIDRSLQGFPRQFDTLRSHGDGFERLPSSRTVHVPGASFPCLESSEAERACLGSCGSLSGPLGLDSAASFCC